MEPSAKPELARSLNGTSQGVVTDAFLECCEARKPHFVPGALSSLAALIDLDSVILAFARGSDRGYTSAHKGGVSYQRGDLFLSYLDHASLTLSEAELFFPPFLELCQSLIPTFDYVTARMVLDPPGPRGPPLQADCDAIAVQLWGEQRWAICCSVAGLPMTMPRPEPFRADMRPGDLLYVPGGMECHTIDPPTPSGGAPLSSTGPNLYILLCVRSSDQSVGTSLGMYINEILRQGLDEDTDKFLRSAITKRTFTCTGVDGGATLRTELRSRFEIAARDVASRITASGVRHHFSMRMEELRNAQKDAAAREAEANAKASRSNSVMESSSVRVAKGVECQCTANESVAFFKRGNETLPLPIAETASHMISALCDGVPHIVSSLPCADPVERLCVAQILVSKECLEVASDRTTGGGGSEQRKQSQLETCAPEVPRLR